MTQTVTAQQTPGSTLESIYSVQGVSRRYGELAALDNVSLEIRKGEWLSIFQAAIDDAIANAS